MPDSQVNICRRCLLRDMGDSEYYQGVVKYRETLPPEYGVSDEIYQERLDLCLGCDELENGVCRQCGCFVEIRASMNAKSCPKPGMKLW